MATTVRKAGRPKVTDPESARRILDAAERLFADFGYNAVSIRDITHAARANLSSVYYHFGSKRELLDAVCRRRLQPIVDRRVAEIRALPRDAPIEARIAAFIGSSIRASLGAAAEANSFRRLVGHLGTDPTPEVRATVGRIYNDSVRDFIATLKTAFPDAPTGTLFWASACSLGVTLYTQGDMTRLQQLFGLAQRPLNAEDAVRQIARFIAGGLVATARHR